MKISYYPGCTLKTKAKNLDRAAIAALEALGVEVQELDRWNCCGAVHSLTADDLIHQVGPVRNLVRAKEQGATETVLAGGDTAQHIVQACGGPVLGIIDLVNGNKTAMAAFDALAKGGKRPATTLNQCRTSWRLASTR